MLREGFPPVAHVVEAEALQVAAREHGVSGARRPGAVFRGSRRLEASLYAAPLEDLRGELEPAAASGVRDVVEPEQVERAALLPTVDDFRDLPRQVGARGRREDLIAHHADRLLLGAESEHRRDEASPLSASAVEPIEAARADHDM